MDSKSTSYTSLMSLPYDKSRDRDQTILTAEEKAGAMEVFGCTNWKDIEPGKFAQLSTHIIHTFFIYHAYINTFSQVYSVLEQRNLFLYLDTERLNDDYVPMRLKQLFIQQTNVIKEQRERQHQAWKIAVKQLACHSKERAALNQRNFLIFFNHAAQYRLVRNAYYALLNDYLQVGVNVYSIKCLTETF